MVKKLILKDHLQAYKEVSKMGFNEIADKIGANHTSVHNWSQGFPITLNEKNIKSLSILANELDIDLPFLLFPIETAERYHSVQRFNEIISPHLQGLWMGLNKEIRELIKKEVSISK